MSRRARRPNHVVLSRYVDHCHDCGATINVGDPIVMIRAQRRPHAVHVACHVARLAARHATKPAPAVIDTITFQHGEIGVAWQQRKAEQDARRQAHAAYLHNLSRATRAARFGNAATLRARDDERHQRNLDQARAAEHPSHAQQQLIANAAKLDNPSGLGLTSH